MLKPPIQLAKKNVYEIALINLETCYSFPNTDGSNNCFTYSPNLNPLWFDIIIPEGSYYVEDINEFIQREIRKNCHYDNENDMDNIEISANTNTLNSEVNLKNNYEVDFRQDKSISCHRGYYCKLYIQDFTSLKLWLIFLLSASKLVIIDIIPGSHVNRFTQPTIYSFFSVVSPGYTIMKNPHNLPYISITSDTIHSITL